METTSIDLKGRIYRPMLIMTSALLKIQTFFHVAIIKGKRDSREFIPRCKETLQCRVCIARRGSETHAANSTSLSRAEFKALLNMIEMRDGCR